MSAKLYKYLASIEAAEPILMGRVKFTPVSELNDPSEMVPVVIPDEVEKSRAYYRENGYSSDDLAELAKQGASLRKLAPMFMMLPVPSTVEEANAIIRFPVYNDLPFLEGMLEQTAMAISSGVGVFCLSERPDSLPMWAHYAANAAGFVAEYQDLDREFVGDETGLLNQLCPVTYGRGLTGVTFDPRSHATLFLAKFADWNYEREVRVILPLSECERVPGENSDIYLRPIDRQRLSRIICGWRMSPEAVRAIADLAKSLNPQVEVTSARVRNGLVCDD